MTSSNASQILTHSTVDCSKIDVTMPSSNKNSEKTAYRSAYVNYLFKNNTPSKFTYMLSKVKLPFGVSYMENYDSYTCSLNLTKDDFEKMTQIEDAVIEKALPLFQQELNKTQKNSKKQKILTADDFSTTLKPEDDDKGYDSLLNTKCKFDKETRKFYTKLVDKNKKVLDFTLDNYSEYLNRGSIVDCLLSCTPWMLNGNYGIAWRPVNIRFLEKGSDNSVDFPDDVSVDEEELETEFEKVSLKKTGTSDTEDELDEVDEYDEAVQNVLKRKVKNSSIKV